MIACFAALLGTPGNSHWLIAPRSSIRKVTRRWLPRTLILETRFETSLGVVELSDLMPTRFLAVKDGSRPPGQMQKITSPGNRLISRTRAGDIE